MKFNETILSGVYLIETEQVKTELGHVEQMFDENEFKVHGLECIWKRAFNVLTAQKASFYGLTYQLPPVASNRLLWCAKGSAYSVVIDLRQESPTFKVYYGAELQADNRKMMYVPKGFAHGYLTLEDNTEICSLSSENYSKEHERGIRHNDREFKVQWPIPPRAMSLRDRRHPEFTPKTHL